MYSQPNRMIAAQHRADLTKSAQRHQLIRDARAQRRTRQPITALHELRSRLVSAVAQAAPSPTHHTL